MTWLTDTLKEELFAAGCRLAEADARGASCSLPVLECLVLSGSKWLLASVNPEDTDLAFGLCQIDGDVPRLGHVRINELLAMRNSRGVVVFADPMFKEADRLDVREYAQMSELTGEICLQFTHTVDATLPSLEDWPLGTKKRGKK